MNQIDIPDYQCYVDCKAKRMVVLRFIQKKLVFQMEISKKKSSLKTISRDIGDMRYVSFFLNLCNSSVCTTCIQSDLSLDITKMVTFQKT